MILYVNTLATDLSASIVTSASDFTPASDIGEFVLGDNEPVSVYFMTAANTYVSWSGTAGYGVSVYLGWPSSDASMSYISTTLATLITSGFSGNFAISGTMLSNAVNMALLGNPRAIGAWFTMQIRVTNPGGNVETFAEVPMFVRARVG